jgi:hypothetical protein
MRVDALPGREAQRGMSSMDSTKRAQRGQHKEDSTKRTAMGLNNKHMPIFRI